MDTEEAGTARVAEDLRCSSWARAQALDPIGTAGSYEGYLLVGYPLPWPADLGDVPALARVAAAARAANVRLQGALPAPNALPDLGDPGGDGRRWARVACYHRVFAEPPTGELPAGRRPFRHLGLVERVVPVAGLAEAALDVLASAVAAGAGGRTSCTEVEDRRYPTREVLVCSHGRRDRCCGSLGTPLAGALEGWSGLAGIRISRTSHTGGHRFAPTAIVLPEATSWGYLDAASLERIVSRTGHPGESAPHYRGCALLGPPAVQAVERAVLGAGSEVDSPGWDLLDLPRWGVAGAGGITDLFVETRPGHVVQFRARVSVRRRVPVPECGQPIEDSRKSADELEVTDLRRLTAPG